jgi:hypothetical protein
LILIFNYFDLKKKLFFDGKDDINYGCDDKDINRNCNFIASSNGQVRFVFIPRYKNGFYYYDYNVQDKCLRSFGVNSLFVTGNFSTIQQKVEVDQKFEMTFDKSACYFITTIRNLDPNFEYNYKVFKLTHFKIVFFLILILFIEISS